VSHLASMLEADFVDLLLDSLWGPCYLEES
jgi:hypothetical protein